VLPQLKGQNVKHVTLLGGDGNGLMFRAEGDGIHVTLAAQPAGKYASVLKLTGVNTTAAK
jgi:hypothetical protein